MPVESLLHRRASWRRRRWPDLSEKSYCNVVKMPEEEFIATRGHRFWVEGTGWLMAKELPAKSSLHSLNGGLAVEAVEPTDAVDCYNLVVDDFHTFVVGKTQLLVHDKTCPQPTTAATPGLANPKLRLPADVIRSETLLLSTAAD